MDQVNELSTREFIKYCKKNGYNSVKFHIVKNGCLICTGEAVDIYHKLIKIHVIGENAMRLSDLEKTLGIEIAFIILENESLYKTYVRFDFLVRGLEIPAHFKGVLDGTEQ